MFVLYGLRVCHKIFKTKQLNEFTMKYIFYNLFKVRGCETNENYLRRAWWKKG